MFVTNTVRVFFALLLHQAGGHQLPRACQLLGQWWSTSTVALVSGLMCRVWERGKEPCV